MKISLMFTCSEKILEKCRPLRLYVMNLISSMITMKDYGTTLDLLLVNIVIQDEGLIELGTKLSRESRDIRVDIALNQEWIERASDWEIKLALLEGIIKAVEITQYRLTRKSDNFEGDQLITDLDVITERLQGRVE